MYLHIFYFSKDKFYLSINIFVISGKYTDLLSLKLTPLGGEETQSLSINARLSKTRTRSTCAESLLVGDPQRLTGTNRGVRVRSPSPAHATRSHC